MKILHEEIQLREETRELAKAKEAIDGEEFDTRAFQLAKTQMGLRDRSFAVAQEIAGLPLGMQNFKREIGILSKVAQVMGEAKTILAKPDVGPDAVAAETEAIELLLESRRNPPGGGGGGGGGGDSGGGGSGTTGRSALADLGPGSEPGAFLEDRDVDQATGRGGRELPEEFRNGLDAYFNALERGS